MAVKKPKKKATTVAKKPKRVATSTALKPLTENQLNQRATELTNSQLQPRLNKAQAVTRLNQGQHDTRNQQIQGWGNWQQQNLDKSFTDTQAALNNLVATQGNVDAANRDALMAALRAGTGSTSEAAQMVMTPDPTEVSGLAGASADATKNSQMSMNAGAGGLMAYMGAQRGLAGVGLQQAVEQERQRHNAAQLESWNSYNDIEAERGGIQAKNLQDLRDFELSKAQFGETQANNMFQQYLAEQELGLKKKDQTFQQWLATKEVNLKADDQEFNQNLQRQQFLHSSQIDWANVSDNRAKTEGMFAQIAADAANAKDAKTQDAAKRRGEGMAKALEWLSSYLQPQKGEASSTRRNHPFGAGVTNEDDASKSTTTYQRLFNDALRGMTNYTTTSDALRILMKSPYSDWRKEATKRYNKLKRRPGKKTKTKQDLRAPDQQSPKPKELTKEPQTRKKPKKK